MENSLTIYQCAALERQIEDKANASGGEISDEDLQQLVLAQTTSIEKLGNLCGYMKYLEAGIEQCKSEQERVKGIQSRAERRLKSIKDWLAPYVQEQREKHGRPLSVGTFTLSARKSTQVQVDEQFFIDNAASWPDLVTKKEVVSPNKTAIKEQLEQGKSIPGCQLVTNTNLQLK